MTCNNCALLRLEIQRLRIGVERYETVRRLTPKEFKDIYLSNITTGKPFDQIIDERLKKETENVNG
jgi:hypothetical protein